MLPDRLARCAPLCPTIEHLASGKVRELYRIDDEHLLFVASDRISAYDYILDCADPRQGSHPDRDERVLLRSGRRAQPPRGPARRRAHSRRRARPRAGRRGTRDDAGRGGRPRLPHRFGAHRLPDGPARCAASRCPPAWSRPASSTEPLFTPATKAELGAARREHLVRRRGRVGRCRAGQAIARADTADLQPGGRARADQGHHRRRHQVRVRRRQGRRPAAGRRGLHPRLVAVLARRRLEGRRRAEQLRQAIRPQLVDRPGLGLGPPRRCAAATAAAGHRRRDQCPLHRGLRTYFGPEVQRLDRC